MSNPAAAEQYLVMYTAYHVVKSGRYGVERIWGNEI
jgi:hypothetical protein